MVQEITEELEGKLLDEQAAFGALQREKDSLVRETDEAKRQLEEDADRCAAAQRSCSYDLFRGGDLTN